jgi:serine/threonine-protein kinase RsbW
MSDRDINSGEPRTRTISRRAHLPARRVTSKTGSTAIRYRPARLDAGQSAGSRTHSIKGPDRSPRVSDLVFSLDKVIPSDLKLLDGAIAEITAAIDRSGCWKDTETISLAVQEAVINAMVHGNHRDPAKTVRVSVGVNEHCDLLIVVKDAGAGFDPDRIADPTDPQHLLVDHGRGIFLMNQLMDRVDFKFDHGTEVHMCRRRQ